MNVVSRLCGVFALLMLPAVLVAATPSSPTELRVKGGRAELIGDGSGFRLSLPDAAPARENKTGGNAWTLVLQAIGDPGRRVDIVSAGQNPRQEATPDGYRLSYDQLVDGAHQVHALGLVLEVRARDDGFVVTGTLTNRTERWMVAEFAGPILGGVEAKLEQHPLLMPYGFGMQVRAVPAEPTKAAKRAPAWVAAGEGVMTLSTHYPSYEASMPWCTFTGADGGFYFGCHDPRQEVKTLTVSHAVATDRFAVWFAHPLACRPGETWSLPPTVIRPYRGTWQTAADIYRAWYDSVRTRPAPVPWVRSSTGWLLAILKQQNTEVLWDYASITKLCDIADERGLDVVGLFGWTEGGHDRWYPVYTPDAPMGGQAGLRAAIAEAHRRGKRIVIYFNGQLIDQDHPFWAAKGRSLTVLERDGKHAFQSWQKYLDTPARMHGLACLGSEAWYQCMVDLALDAQRHGADGIIYDQLGMTLPMTCYASGHGHAVPAVVYGEDRARLLRRIRERMSQVDPSFMVMTEGLHDAVLDSVSIFHGCVLGVFAPTAGEVKALQGGPVVFAAFPDLFRYTFPEVLTTIRNPRPMEDRRTANYACLYGMKHEIETRYAADKAYLLDGRMPTAKDYENIVSKPSLGAILAENPAKSAQYLRTMIDFQRTHAALLWQGRFLGGSGFALSGPPTLLAKAYAGMDGRMAVVVWNPEKRPASFEVSVPGMVIEEAFEPERRAVDPRGPLAGNCVRLLVAAKR